MYWLEAPRGRSTIPEDVRLTLSRPLARGEPNFAEGVRVDTLCRTSLIYGKVPMADEARKARSGLPGQPAGDHETVDAKGNPQGSSIEAHASAPKRGGDSAKKRVGTRSSRQSDSPGEELRGSWTRLKRLSVFALGLAIDLMFLGVWLVLQQSAHWLFDRIGELPGVVTIFRIVLELLFDGATLAVVGAYVVRDVVLTVKKIWRRQ